MRVKQKETEQFPVRSSTGRDGAIARGHVASEGLGLVGAQRKNAAFPATAAPLPEGESSEVFGEEEDFSESLSVLVEHGDPDEPGPFTRWFVRRRKTAPRPEIGRSPPVNRSVFFSLT